MTDPTSASTSDAAARCAELTVLYDGACPLCRREVGMYKGLTPLEPVAWRDISEPNAALPAEAATAGDRAAYLARFHVQRADGQVLSGAEAFVALWSALPGWRWLGRVAALPGVTPVMEVVYRLFLRVRPGLQWVARELEKPKGDFGPK